jgi:DNA modification methylase
MAVHRLMAGDAADLVFTDPPCNVAYEGYNDEKLTITGDRLPPEQFRVFLENTFANYRQIVKAGTSLYVCHPSSAQREFQNAMEAAGFEIRCRVIWAKITFAWGFGRYKFRHEPIFYAHVAGQSDAWYGDKSQSTLWEENKPAAPAASSWVANTVMLLFSSMVNIFIIAFLSLRALAVMTSIALKWLKSKEILEKDQV